jgi:hypothetical protein
LYTQIMQNMYIFAQTVIDETFLNINRTFCKCKFVFASKFNEWSKRNTIESYIDINIQIITQNIFLFNIKN